MTGTAPVDRFGIRGLVLLSLYEGLDVHWRDQADYVPELR